MKDLSPANLNTRNVDGNRSGRKKMILDRNIDLQKELKITALVTTLVIIQEL